MKKYYYDFSSLDYTVEFLKMDEGTASSYRYSGVLHGPFDNLREAKTDARKVVKHYIGEIKDVYDSITPAQVEEL